MTQPFLQTIDDLRHTVKVNASFKFEILEPYLQDAFDRYIVPYLGEALVDRLYREPLTEDILTIKTLASRTRGWKPWCLPSCAPAGQARFRSLRKRSTIVWQRLTNNTDNRNFEKAKEEGKNLPLSFIFSEIPADGGAPPDDKSGSPPRRTSPHTRS